LFVFYGLTFLSPGSGGEQTATATDTEIIAEAAQAVFRYNLFLPLVGGILAADRMQRDFKLGVRELQNSTPAGRWAYILAKYCGVLASMLLPVFAWIFTASVLVAMGILSDPGGLVNTGGQASLAYIGGSLLAFLAINVPAFAFVTAFSLACPLVMPLRVYQVLFTGYWFWGNFLNPDVFPTLSDTLLTPSGMYALGGFFQTGVVVNFGGHTLLEAWLNLLVLALCVAAVFVTLERYLAWQSRRA
jgi:ABC-2 type transport system permease protein